MATIFATGFCVQTFKDRSRRKSRSLSCIDTSCVHVCARQSPESRAPHPTFPATSAKSAQIYPTPRHTGVSSQRLHIAPAPTRLSALRLSRLQKWLSLWLVWFVAHVLAHIAPPRAAAMLAQARRRTRILLLIHALRRVAPPAQPHKPRCYDPARTCRELDARVLVGHALNRALKAPGAIAQAQHLYAILANPERWIARIVRRLMRRYTKLRRAPRFEHAIPLRSFAAPTAFAADTS